MKNLKALMMFLGLLFAGLPQAATLYVGVGSQCNGSNHYDNLHLAILQAAINGTENDEIRLTNTVTYIGALNGSYVLSGWNGTDNGRLTIVGGFSNCNSPSSSGKTVIGEDTEAVFDITADSDVTFRNLSLTNSQSRGVIVRGSSSVFFENVDVSGNAAGIRILEGSVVSIDADSIVQNNGDLDGIPRGGGIWCFGTNSAVYVSGRIVRNQAVNGGNMYVSNGCFAELLDGAEIKGDRSLGFQYSAHSGGGIWVHDGGELFVSGGAQRVFISDHRAINDGAGIYVRGTGKATLFNTYIVGNVSEGEGAAIFAIDGGGSEYQLVMDRAADCPFFFSCSEIERNTFVENLVQVRNSRVKIQRTLFDRNEYFSSELLHFNSLVDVDSGGTLHMSHSTMFQNKTRALVNNFSASQLSHITAAGNNTIDMDGNTEDSYVWWTTLGSLRIENSIFQDTQGADTSGAAPNISGQCNLIDNSIGWPVGAYVVGSATFNNVGGDLRQQASSDGVDMCLQDTFAWSNDVDIEYQNAPVNEFTNPQGNPGNVNGLYDAGSDEVYDNIGDDEFLLTVEKEGSGEGFVISDPLGIACGTDCTEVFFNGTLVTLTATPTGNSDFIEWINCPLVNGSNQCLISLTASTTIRAVFQPDDLIFSNGFE